MPALSLPILFGLGELAPSKRRALTLVFASSLALMMGVNFIQPALPAMTQAFGISDSELTWMELYYVRFKEPRLARFLCRLRPLYNWRTGGDATPAWGVKDLSC